MAIICKNPWVFQGDPGDPPEYEYTDPVTCATCGEVHDDVQEGETWESDYAGDPQCMEGDCLKDSQFKLFRQEASEAALDGIQGALEATIDMENMFSGRAYDAREEFANLHVTPSAILEEAKMRIERVRDGRPVGWSSDHTAIPADLLNDVRSELSHGICMAKMQAAEAIERIAAGSPDVSHVYDWGLRIALNRRYDLTKLVQRIDAAAEEDRGY